MLEPEIYNMEDHPQVKAILSSLDWAARPRIITYPSNSIVLTWEKGDDSYFYISLANRKIFVEMFKKGVVNLMAEVELQHLDALITTFGMRDVLAHPD